MNENREYRSDVFGMLMEEPKYALEVYNALNNTNYEDPSLVQMARLDGGISLSIRNDAAFIVKTDLNLYEHQSTYNPNMPMRCLLYYAEIISGMVKNRNLYGRTLIKLPTPHFVVFYNGLQKRPELETMYLSDCFEKKTDDPEIELKVKVYNINCGNNKDFLERCEVLRQYMFLIDKVQEYLDAIGNLEYAINRAVNCCIEEHVLEDFLRARKGEVSHNMKLDYTWERQIELERAAGREEGREEGLAEGLMKGKADIVRRLYSNGMDISTITNMLNLTAQEVEELLAL